MTSPLPIDLMIFDLDGTLTDSIPPAIEALQEMLLELGLPYKHAAEINRYVGFGELPLLEGTIGSKDPELVGKASAIYERVYIEKGLKKIPLYPHVREILEAFDGKIKVIVSNKKDEFIKIILENHALAPYFSEVIGGDTAACLKPDPCVIKDILKKYKVKPKRALFIGDMTVDIRTGKNAGTLTCGVTYGFDGKEKLEKEVPDLLVDDLLELRGLIV